jgi:putative chitinase
MPVSGDQCSLEVIMCIEFSVGTHGRNDRSDVAALQALLNLNLACMQPMAPLEVDGLFGDQTEAALRRFCEVKKLTAPSPMQIEPGNVIFELLRDGILVTFERGVLQAIMPLATNGVLDVYGPRFPICFETYEIDTPLRQAHFLAQVAHESASLRCTEEEATGDAYEGRVDLGNTQPGDGRRFKGRGLIQLTGRANYRDYGAAIGLDLLSDAGARKVASDPALAVDVAGWFWDTHELNAVADRDDVEQVTRVVNGALNGLAERRRFLARAKFCLRA